MTAKNLQWIGMEYATIRQAVFLRWQKEGRGALPYETLRDYMVVISRMTGYEEEDIREYLENSFEELLWEIKDLTSVLEALEYYNIIDYNN
mgnify:CR=1 FL=1